MTSTAPAPMTASSRNALARGAALAPTVDEDFTITPTGPLFGPGVTADLGGWGTPADGYDAIYNPMVTAQANHDTQMRAMDTSISSASFTPGALQKSLMDPVTASIGAIIPKGDQNLTDYNNGLAGSGSTTTGGGGGGTGTGGGGGTGTGGSGSTSGCTANVPLGSVKLNSKPITYKFSFGGFYYSYGEINADASLWRFDTVRTNWSADNPQWTTTLTFTPSRKGSFTAQFYAKADRSTINEPSHGTAPSLLWCFSVSVN